VDRLKHNRALITRGTMKRFNVYRYYIGRSSNWNAEWLHTGYTDLHVSISFERGKRVD
jgi:hypothetical protein